MSQTGMPPDLLHTPHLTIAPACAQIAMDRLVAQYGSQYLLNGKLVINETADCAR